ncbi:hypothetical protein L873DRAFT_1833532 [Choiromyces venosus 120613-1]|uniref:DUF1996 domain-containing protein n=1 Tax=Choiromyces venosus 120613-1 TaxID=1336337 RepID=A0A3N4K0N5_9PEZI|nr:hypothetical protein L873DRAFT_1833532 [Choiromyces venosus 120613-1]
MINSLALLSLFALEASAFWRLPCRQSLTVERIDPLTQFGGVGEHVHTIHGGNSKFSASSLEADLMQSTCSSCQVKQDRSAYWTPAMYFQDEAGNFNVVNQLGGMLVYYLPRGKDVKAFPDGFRMIAGDPTLRHFPYKNIEKSLWTAEDRTEAALRQKAIGFNCLNYDLPAEAALGMKTMPENLSCKDGLRTEIFFPSCWNGKDLDSKNHRDHMRYPSLMDDGDCPEGFETRLVSLFYETIWDVNKFSGQKGRFMFSTGDPTGCGYHGDFMNAWNKGVLQDAIDECTSPSGMIEECKVFDLYTLDEMHQCTIERTIPEDVVGPMKQLPGCNAVTEGPEPAKVGGCPGEGLNGGQSSSAPSATKTTPKPKETKQVETSKVAAISSSSLPMTFKPSASPVPSDYAKKQDFDVSDSTSAPDPYLVIITVTETVAPPATTITIPAPESQNTTPPRKKRSLHNHRKFGGRHHKH